MKNVTKNLMYHLMLLVLITDVLIDIFFFKDLNDFSDFLLIKESLIYKFVLPFCSYSRNKQKF